MGYDLLLEIIEYIGPLALFLVLCLGLIGLPIPNEAVALTGGALAESGLLHEALAYIMLSLGICSAMTFNYSLGRFTSSRLSRWFSDKQKLGTIYEKSQKLVEKYGVYAIPISVFFPFLRHATPYVMGMNRLKFTRFILIGYPAAMLWSGVYYMLGHYVGDNMPEIIATIKRYEGAFYIGLTVCSALLVLIFLRKFQMRQAQKQLSQQQDNNEPYQHQP